MTSPPAPDPGSPQLCGRWALCLAQGFPTWAAARPGLDPHPQGQQAVPRLPRRQVTQWDKAGPGDRRHVGSTQALPVGRITSHRGLTSKLHSLPTSLLWNKRDKASRSCDRWADPTSLLRLLPLNFLEPEQDGVTAQGSRPALWMFPALLAVPPMGTPAPGTTSVLSQPCLNSLPHSEGDPALSRRSKYPGKEAKKVANCSHWQVGAGAGKPPGLGAPPQQCPEGSPF